VLGHGQVDPVEDQVVAEALLDPAQLQERRAVGPVSHDRSPPPDPQALLVAPEQAVGEPGHGEGDHHIAEGQDGEGAEVEVLAGVDLGPPEPVQHADDADQGGVLLQADEWDSPSERAAAVWLQWMLSIPARYTSATYPP